MERKINVLDKFWKWYVGIGNGGFADFNADPDPDPDPDPNPQPGKDEVDVGGVKYTLDAEGNHINAAGVAVLGSEE